MRLLVSGGGSAGHVLPALAVLDALGKQDEVLYVGSHQGPDARLAAKKYPYRGIFTGKLRRYGRGSWLHPLLLLQNLGDGLLLLVGTLQALWICWRFKPDVVFCNGGFTSVPVALAAAALHRPILIQEADQAFGIANRILRRFARVVCVAYPSANPDAREIVTGNPLRADLFSAARESLPASLPLSKDLPIVLVMGGTKGAQRINGAIFPGLVQLLDKANVVHLTGETDSVKAHEFRRRLSKAQQERYLPVAFLNEGYPSVLGRADVVVTRAGAGSLWEAAALGRAMIVIPITRSANDHQRLNAEYFAKRGGAVVLREQEIGQGNLVHVILQLLQDDQRRSELGDNASKAINLDAASKIATELRRLGNRSSEVS